eukprot:1145340-Pelagomonas_calceolata.AAC.5
MQVVPVTPGCAAERQERYKCQSHQVVLQSVRRNMNNDQAALDMQIESKKSAELRRDERSGKSCSM